MKWTVTLVLAANAFVLVGVAINRSGEPESTITLTERELHFAPRDQEDTGVILRLQWDRALAFDQAKLRELGVDPSAPDVPPKPAYVAFDPLMVVDASLDAAALRHKYPDRARYRIVPCAIRMNRGSPPEQPRARLAAVLVSQIYVPLEHRRKFDALGRLSSWQHFNQKDKPAPGPRYTVTLSYGKRYEPWIVDVRMR